MEVLAADRPIAGDGVLDTPADRPPGAGCGKAGCFDEGRQYRDALREVLPPDGEAAGDVDQPLMHRPAHPGAGRKQPIG